MTLQVSTITFVGEQWKEDKIALFSLHPLWKKRANIPALDYPCHRNIQLGSGS